MSTPRATAAGLGVVVMLGMLLATGGCRSLGLEGPIPKSLASCRQLSQQGLTAMERGEWQRAEEMLARAVQTCPADADARRRYAEALWHRGAAREAVAQLEQVRQSAGDDAALCYRLGEMYLSMNQFELARQAAEKALDVDPKSAAAWAMRGRAMQATGKTREALADYQRSLGYAPNNCDVVLRVAEAYRQLNQPERALVALESLAENYSPGEEPQQVLYLEGISLVAMGRYNEAVASLRQAAERGRPTAEILCRLGEAELLAGREAPARAALQQALALEPNHPTSRQLMDRLGGVRQAAALSPR